MPSIVLRFCAALLALLSAGVCAQNPLQLPTPLSLGCSGCHGTYGQALSAMPVLAGRDEAALLEQLRAFREGRRTGTVMHQIARGYTDEELVQLARFYSTAGGKP